MWDKFFKELKIKNQELKIYKQLTVNELCVKINC